jgi:uncharacterized membrane protein YfcA
MSLVRILVMPTLPKRPTIFGASFERDLVIIVPFAIVMILAATAMIRKPHRPAPKKIASSGKARGNALQGYLTAALAGLVVGGMSGFVGAGGGFMVIPALHLLLGLPMAAAVGTSLMVIAINSSSGAISDVVAGTHADYALAGLMSILSLAGMAVGVHFGKRIDSNRLKPAFGYFLIFMALTILIKEAFAR